MEEFKTDFLFNTGDINISNLLKLTGQCYLMIYDMEMFYMLIHVLSEMLLF